MHGGFNSRKCITEGGRCVVGEQTVRERCVGQSSVAGSDVTMSYVTGDIGAKCAAEVCLFCICVVGGYYVVGSCVIGGCVVGGCVGGCDVRISLAESKFNGFLIDVFLSGAKSYLSGGYHIEGNTARGCVTGEHLARGLLASGRLAGDASWLAGS